MTKAEFATLQVGARVMLNRAWGYLQPGQIGVVVDKGEVGVRMKMEHESTIVLNLHGNVIDLITPPKPDRTPLPLPG
jgi:hypothetical protein